MVRTHGSPASLPTLLGQISPRLRHSSPSATDDRRRCIAALVGGVALGMALAATPAFAELGAQAARPQSSSHGSHGAVLPASARPLGYSLADMARLTAAFNVGDRSGPPPNSPIQMLYVNLATGNVTFNVTRGTFLYVPIVFSDNSLPLLGNFPAHVESRHQLLHYWFSQSEVGITVSKITVDGETVSLGGHYVSGVGTGAPLPNGATKYIASAAFLTPLARGSHQVSIHAKATGDALRRPPFDEYFPEGFFEFTTTYTVNVR